MNYDYSYLKVADDDITVIMKYTYDEFDNVKTAELVGWHYGDPDENSGHFIGKLKAEFDF